MPAGQALLRSGARAGDELWVSGTLGDARAALEVLPRHARACPATPSTALRRAMEMPEPRVALGHALRGVASSAIDVSDGLLGDLGHVLRRSAVGARLDVDALPRSALLAALPPAVQRDVPAARRRRLRAAVHGRAGAARRPCSPRRATPACRSRCIGRIEPGAGLVVVDGRGQALAVERGGFDHFRA